MSTSLTISALITSNVVRKYEYEILKRLSSYNLSICILDLKDNSNLNSILDKFLQIDKKINARGVDYFDLVSIDDLNLNVVSNIEQEYDVLINFTNTDISKEIANFAKYGVWELRYGMEQLSSQFAGICEVGKREDLSKIVLVSNETILDTFSTATHLLSPVKNRSNLLHRSYLILVRNINKLSQNRDRYIDEKRSKLSFIKDGKSFCQLNIFNLLSIIFSLSLRNVISRVDKLFRKQQWSIYYALNDQNSDYHTNMSDFKEIPTPKRFFWADPFVVDKDDKSYIFFEEYLYKTHKGHLSVIEYDHESKKFSDSKEILNTPYHLSYPFMMEYEGEFYMIPEGSADNDIKLYKATNFPYEWELVKVLMKDVIAVDTTLFYHDRKWWMFTNMVEDKGLSLNEELYIFYCDDFLKDEWIPHDKNPVVSSLRTSRPAGKILEYRGELYRPSQNSVGWYGKSTNFNKILTLSETEYKEEFISEITPEMIDGIYAIHTYNSSKKMTVVDGLKKIGRFF